MTDERLRRLPHGSSKQIAERLRSADMPCQACGGKLRVWRDPGNIGRTMWYGDGPCTRCGMEVRPCLCSRDARSCDVCCGTGLHFRPRVELAAYCGSPEARDAIRGQCPVYCPRPTHTASGPTCPRGPHHHADDRCVDTVPTTDEERFDRLRGWGAEVIVRAIVTAVRFGARQGLNRVGSAAVLAAAEAWLVEQTPQREHDWQNAWSKWAALPTRAEILLRPPRMWFRGHEAVPSEALAPIRAVVGQFGGDAWVAVSRELIDWALR